MTRRSLLLSPLSLAVQPPVDDDDEVPSKSLFERLFPNPTGNNGYEDLIRAGEILGKSTAFAPAEQSDATLTVRRKASRDPFVRQALDLIRTGVAKPIVSPYPSIDPTRFGEFARFRQLARLLNNEMLVQCADGRTGAAIVRMAQGLTIARTITPHALLGGLVGVAVEAIVLTRLVRHLPQMTPADCDQIVRTIAQHLPLQRAAFVASLDREPVATEAMLREMFATPLPDPSQEAGGEEEDPTDPEPDDGLAAALMAARNDPKAQEEAIQTFRKAHDQRVAVAKARLIDPTKRVEIVPPSTTTLGGLLSATMLGIYGGATDKFIQGQVNARLLAVHAQIRRYQWEFARLPDALSALDAPDWTGDPCTGQPLLYERKEDTYTLCSAGLPTRDDDDQPVGAPVPIYLPYRRPQ
jgi:hypothetical protein